MYLKHYTASKALEIARGYKQASLKHHPVSWLNAQIIHFVGGFSDSL